MYYVKKYFVTCAYTVVVGGKYMMFWQLGASKSLTYVEKVHGDSWKQSGACLGWL